jgi:hypothetical protein
LRQFHDCKHAKEVEMNAASWSGHGAGIQARNPHRSDNLEAGVEADFRWLDVNNILANLPWLGFVLSVLVSWHADAQMPIGVVPPTDHRSANSVILPFVTVRAIEQDKKALRFYAQGRGDVSAGDCTVDLDAKKRAQIVGLEPPADGYWIAKSRYNAVYVHTQQRSSDLATLRYCRNVRG